MIVYPKHDKINKPNAIPTLLALHNIKFKEGIRDQNKINFIIGGSSKYFKFGDATIQKIYEEILFLSNNYLVKIIPSRRTPINFIKNLKKMNLKNVSIFEDQFNPTEYGNLLSEASTQIATWDSISMISEAISSGTKTLIFPFEEKKCPKRYKDFYNNILEENFISFYNRDLKAPTPDLTGYNNELKSKILNKIESNLWFKTDAPQGFNTK
jgi:mitochondrial fission protein ELM1